MRCLSLTVCLTLVASLLVVPARAAPGDLDPSFGTGGKVTTDFGPGSNSAMAVAIQTDARIVVAGGSGSGDFALARYNTNGSLDTSFGTGGKVTTDFGVFDAASALAIQADGRIVAAGGTSPGGFCCQFALARYNADGSLDTSFNGSGKVTTIFGGDTRAFAVAVQRDGKIIAAGGTMSPFAADFALVRYNPDGSLDTSFGIGGKVTTDFGGFDSATGVAIQADGKIVVVGEGGPSSDFVLARYNPDGSLDAGFGNGGRVTTDFGGFDAASGVAMQEDGKIVAAGRGGFFIVFALARYNADGSLDTSFAGSGKVTTQFFGQNIESAKGLAIQKNGKIVVVGTAFSDFDPSFAVARYNGDGSLDTSFSGDGKVTTDFGDPADVGRLCPPGRKDCSEDNAAAVAIQPDGRIVAVGGAGACIPPCKFALARYLGDPTATEVSIDIKPGSTINPINLSSPGLVPVAILTTDTFDATTVDPATVCFGNSNNPSQGECTEAHGMGHVEDVNGDGRSDLVLHFQTGQLGITRGDTRACLTGRTIARIDIHGCDTISTK